MKTARESRRPADRSSGRRRRRVRIVVLALTTWVLAAPAAALAAGSWTQFQGGPAHTGTADDGVEAPFRQAWQLDVPNGGPQGRSGVSPPVLAGDTLIAVGPTQVLGVDLATGARRWSVQRDSGPSVPPAVAQVGGRQVLVYTEGLGTRPQQGSATPSASSVTPSASAASTPSASTPPSQSASPGAAAAPPVNAHLAAIDLSTRAAVWDPVQLQRASRSGVTIDGPRAFVGDDAGTIYAVDVASGRIVWTTKTGGSVDTPIAASGGRLFVAVQGSSSTFAAVVALNESDGSRAWRFESPREVLASAPSVGGGAIVLGFAGVSSTVVRALDAGTGAERWSARVTTTLTPFGAPALAPDAIIAQDVNSQVYRFDLGTGDRSWDFALNDPAIRTSPVISGAQVLVASNDGRLVAIDGGTGQLVWRSPPQSGLLRSPLVTPDLVVLVRGGARAGLVAFAHDDAGSLVRIDSPTTIDPLGLFGGFVAAAAPLAAVLLLAGRWLAGRAGPAFADSQEPADAWERDDDDVPDDPDDPGGDAR